MKELFTHEGFLIAFTISVLLTLLSVLIALSTVKEYELKKLAIEHQCEKIYDANVYYYGNCKK